MKPGPNFYEMQNKNLTITYQSTGTTGQQELTYESKGDFLSFKGEQICCENTEIGQQITVTLKNLPDEHALTLTLLLPQINLVPKENKTSFTTKAIVTTHRTSIGGPDLIKGALQTYHIEALIGKASEVNFL